MDGTLPMSHFSRSCLISVRRAVQSEAVRTALPFMNVNGSGRKLLRGNASKSGGSSPVRCCHSLNCGALGSDLSIHSRWARRSCSLHGPERIGERHEREGDRKEAERHGQYCFHGSVAFSRSYGPGIPHHDTRAVGRGAARHRAPRQPWRANSSRNATSAFTSSGVLAYPTDARTAPTGLLLSATRIAGIEKWPAIVSSAAASSLAS